MRRKNGKAIYQAIIGSTGLKFGICFAWVKKPPWCGSYGMKLWQLMSGELGLPQPLFPNNAHFALPNTIKYVKHKFWDCIQTRTAWRWAMFIMRELCGIIYTKMHEQATMIISTKNNPCLGNEFLRSLSKSLKFGTSYVALRFGLFELNAMAKCSTKNNGMNPRSNTRSGMSWSSTLRRHGTEWSNRLT